MLRYSRRFIVVISLALVVFLVMGCSGATPEPAQEEPTQEEPAQVEPTQEEPAQEEPTHLKLLIMPYVSYLPLYIAQQEGYFAEQNLDVEFVELDRTTDATIALAQGDIDIGTGILTTSILNAMAKGANVKFVADKGFIDPDGCVNAAILVRNGLEDITPEQMAGLTVLAQEQTYHEYLMDKALEPAGLTLQDMEPILIPPPALMGALESGELDVAPSGDPFVTQVVQAGVGTIWGTANEYTPNFQLNTILFGPTILEENPDAGIRFLAANYKGVQQYLEGRTERNIEAVVEATGMERELVEQICWTPLRADMTFDVDSLLDFQEWAISKGYLDTALPVEQMVDPSFVDAALEMVGEK
jgi:NitT/TauT family transport system substrate-binding protein